MFVKLLHALHNPAPPETLKTLEIILRLFKARLFLKCSVGGYGGKSALDWGSVWVCMYHTEPRKQHFK